MYIDFVGAKIDVRGRGLASCLLRHTLVAAMKSGFEEATLVVDLHGSYDALKISAAWLSSYQGPGSCALTTSI